MSRVFPGLTYETNIIMIAQLIPTKLSERGGPSVPFRTASSQATDGIPPRAEDVHESEGAHSACGTVTTIILSLRMRN